MSFFSLFLIFQKVTTKTLHSLSYTHFKMNTNKNIYINCANCSEKQINNQKFKVCSGCKINGLYNQYYCNEKCQTVYTLLFTFRFIGPNINNIVNSKKMKLYQKFHFLVSISSKLNKHLFMKDHALFIYLYFHFSTRIH